ncbi:MAG TPA: 3D-(3,5/4)-trihydroxycyclohexane-1,2-dione acylhydrolase (decyclizing) [Candidatus Limnocylindria bacterium]|nr:3D-(3,5/4)-trihydroxycyclohexane-1,2-dione acylhydrolase (decyclizing) [Candidatus Limnocylindria bacterium]
MTRLTVAQALVRFLGQQYVERDGVEQRFFAGCWGVFGHGNVAGLGQALAQYPESLRYHQARNEQSMVHIAVGYARMKDRLSTFACTTSIGPGATNLVTGAALATVNRLPVLLLPGDSFASRSPDPVLQQLETPSRGDASVNDTLQAVSTYWDRIMRPEQIVPAALHAMLVLTDPAETGAVTLALPQDVQTEAFDVPAEFLAKRVWHIERRPPDTASFARAIELINAARRPLIVAGGGVIYSGATAALRAFVDRSGIPVAETQAGKGSLPYDHPLALGAIGATGTFAANRVGRDADLVIGIGTRWTDFTTASKTLFEGASVRFINLNVASVDAYKLNALPLLCDARVGLEALAAAEWVIDERYRTKAEKLHAEWDAEVTKLYGLDHTPAAQSAVIGAVNAASGPRDVVVGAAGSLPGELHKLWRTRDPKGYHVEYGYSCMGYEIPGGIGAKLAAPDREVYVMVGDGSYLMSPGELSTAITEGAKLIVVLVDNHGFGSIGALSRSLGTNGFGTASELAIDFVANAASLGARAVRARTISELRSELTAAQSVTETTVIVIETDPLVGVPSYESWWEVVPAETSEQEGVRKARQDWSTNKKRQRMHL